ncbi:aminomethyl-transferring glycine dehydrogenase subunit GcvPA [Robinsoniella peoriensis]|uniref:Probable glycine dehydrogenase (decarboxylating) subunit 1 n=1 Tax=Robinsoniella peoriensis TaxID=180332 RepID=A0A4U8Q766_9FIRM|nr:aminomethyl-transferring glycine dehydrogenase subunit GcvPA [Robinsoniella peoriensis]TLD00164.1 putative glycine dehydrogenase [decarboxylating] subunit 1 [Robinsoniella peoriensis]
MGSYVVSTREEQEQMLKTMGYTGFQDLFSGIPEEIKLNRDLNIPPGCSEMEVLRRMEELANENKVFRHIFRGAGAYHHYIPSAVNQISQKEEFLTAYTPYQAEISQGILQSIFEYQTMICELTGMDVSNASVYDGATAAAEAAAMCRDRKRTKIVVSAAVNPQVIRTIQTYCFGNGSEVLIVPEKSGETDLQALEAAMTEDACCFYVQQPNYYGILENYGDMEKIVHKSGAMLIMGCNPIALAVLKTPGEYGADVAVGDGQPLGLPLGFGGPYQGFMTVRSSMARKLPGRIVGETTDEKGNRAFVLTLQAREQHIRREKAGSNICSNQALCTLRAAIYMAVMGSRGMEEAARQCTAKAHYLQQELEKTGYELKYQKPFFHEFVTRTPVPAEKALNYLEKQGILGGLPLSDREILWCTTEMNTRAEMDKLTAFLKEVRE